MLHRVEYIEILVQTLLLHGTELMMMQGCKRGWQRLTSICDMINKIFSNPFVDGPGTNNFNSGICWAVLAASMYQVTDEMPTLFDLARNVGTTGN
ncbi:hypothetical protein OUZ56_016177 [Daphnia magna]|uniref:Uncharacterized protein n=1 Tax=Daphnia magna TaxID=35525 RepID=A0ABR0APW3_9CRUS|nr:hypothetical protein OUZ56_016177 [Daphnia magna]